MSRDTTTLHTVLTQFDRLQRVGFKRPELPKEASALAEAYLEHLTDLPAAAVEAGITHFIREDTSRWWPKVADVRKAALTARRVQATGNQTTATAKYWAWEKSGMRTEDGKDFLPCPVCDAVFPEHGRALLRHDHQRHVEAGVLPYVRG